MVDTRNSPGHRKLRFNSIDDCMAEVRRIVDADAEGKLRTTGNWTSGQILGHVGSWIAYGYDGYPLSGPPFFVRWILRMRLKKMLENGMPRGVRIPGVKTGTVGVEAVEISVAAERLLSCLCRLRSREEAKFDSPAFGAMSHDDRIRLNLRHAELHLGYLNY